MHCTHVTYSLPCRKWRQEQAEEIAARDAEVRELERKLEESSKSRDILQQQTEAQIREQQRRAAERQSEMSRVVGSEVSAVGTPIRRGTRSLRGGRGRRSLLTSTAAGMGYFSRFL